MKATGIVRNIDPLGRIVLPKELRRTRNLEDGTPLEIFMSDDGAIVLRQYTPGCSCCGRTDNLKEYRGVSLCQRCIDAFNSVSEQEQEMCEK